MTDRWRQIEGVFHRALELNEPERGRFLDESCGKDLDLRAEVDRLLHNHASDPDFLGSAAIRYMADQGPIGNRLKEGASIGAYVIGPLIGRGGMGEVYRAHDSRLDRDVAVKALPGSFASDPERIDRFQREARLLGSLNHPNIATIFGLEEVEGERFIVMELVEGETLAARLERGPILVDDAVEIATGITRALEGAHGKNVIHRDLKPANVKVTPEGQVKVLDFGLAKALEPAGMESSASKSPALDVASTQSGMILGTAAYMSPEQARGRRLDAGTDIWALGCILYEMLSGNRAFEGEESADILANVVRAEPDEEMLPALDARLLLVLRRCLRKDARDRWQAAGDIRIELESIRSDPRQESTRGSERYAPAPLSPGRRLARRWVPALGLALAAGVAGAYLGPRLFPPDEGRVVSSEYVLPEGQDFMTLGRSVADISADGRSALYHTDDGIFLNEAGTIGAFEAEPIPGVVAPLAGPFFSNDGQDVAYASGNQVAGSSRLMTVRRTGGNPKPLCDIGSFYGGSWGAGDTILYGQTDGIWQVSADGGECRRIIETGPGEQAYGPRFLPGGWVMFTLARGSGDSRWDQADIVAESPSTGERRLLWPGGSDARYLPTGHLTFGSGENLLAVPFDVDHLAPTGDAVVVVTGIQRPVFDPRYKSGTANYAVSDNGTLIYATGSGSSVETTLAIVDSAGERTPIDLPRKRYIGPRISPREDMLAVETQGEDANHIWIYSISGDREIYQLTLEGSNIFPVWWGNERIIFASNRSGTWDIYQKAVSGAVAQLVFAGEDGVELWPTAISPDGTLVYTRVAGIDDWSLWTLSLDGASEPQPLSGSRASQEAFATFSRDGTRMAFMRIGADSIPDIWVEPFPATGQQWMITTTGAADPVLSEGRLFFNALAGKADPLRSVDVFDRDSGFEWGIERMVEGGTGLIGTVGQEYDVFQDGERIVGVFSESPTQAIQPRVRFVQNWFQILNERAPAGR